MEAVLTESFDSNEAYATRPRVARRAVTALFFLNGALFATWVSRIPAIQAARGLGNGALGLSLLAVAIGAVISMPLAGVLLVRYGSARICRVAAWLYAAGLPCMAFNTSPAFFIFLLATFGVCHGALDVGMNSQAVEVEKRYNRPIMSSFHALFSTGGLVGAAAGGFMASLGMEPLAHFAVIALLVGAAMFFVLPNLLNAGGDQARTAAVQTKQSGFPWPSRGLIALGVVALCVMMGEGAMADWIAVYLRNNLGTRESIAAIGYATFSLAMAGGRFGGDYLTSRLGPVQMVRLGGVLATVGVLLALLFSNSAVALIGFALVGAGFSTGVPIVFTATGNVPGVAPGVALSSVTTVGYLGFLIGPPLIGFAAELMGLRLALGIIAATSFLTVILAATVRPAPLETKPEFVSASAEAA